MAKGFRVFRAVGFQVSGLRAVGFRVDYVLIRVGSKLQGHSTPLHNFRLFQDDP